MINELRTIASLENDTLKIIKVNLYHFNKRLLDIIISLIGLLFLIPIALIIKIANVINKDYSKIIFKQQRIGLNGKLFTIYKFRSMYIDAEEKLGDLLKDNKYKIQYKKNKKIDNDPRITKVGKFIRKTSIDEIPQLINVLKGDMSLVGNRPYLPHEKEDMKKYYKSIVSVKPGLTGLWQISGRSKTTFNKRLELENWYSKNKTLMLDIEIFLKTFKSVLIDKFAK